MYPFQFDHLIFPFLKPGRCSVFTFLVESFMENFKCVSLRNSLGIFLCHRIDGYWFFSCLMFCSLKLFGLKWTRVCFFIYFAIMFRSNNMSIIINFSCSAMVNYIKLRLNRRVWLLLHFIMLKHTNIFCWCLISCRKLDL